MKFLTNTDVPAADVVDIHRSGVDMSALDLSDIAAARCVVARDILDRVGDKWSVLVIALLNGQSRRFSELQRTIDGISQRMLTLTLRQLERDGLVLRTVHPTVPPRVDYALTELGQTILVPIVGLAKWAEAHGGDVAEARRVYDERRAANATVIPA